MAASIFDELKGYVGFGPADEHALRAFLPLARPHFVEIASTFYQRILEHPDARKALEGGESTVGRLKVTLVAWMEKLLSGPWDEEYFQLRCRIGRVHVRISLPQHYMFGAMNVVRREMNALLDQAYPEDAQARSLTRAALGRILDLELAIMLHTYREDLIDQAARTERLSTFGQLVGSIGHELRNPLGVIETSLFILQGRVSGDERAQKHVQRISEQVGIANGIVSSLLDMIRDRPPLRAAVPLAPLIASAASAVHRPEGVRLSLVGLEALSLDGDPTQLRQLFLNLIDNAVQAASPEGEVWVRAEHPVAGGRVRVAVEDTGPGVDPAVRARLFEPLVTTRVKGIGLGLALVKRIAERHGGSVSYAPREGGGARFQLELPRS
jgi:signal transduction histidine kinase